MRLSRVILSLAASTAMIAGLAACSAGTPETKPAQSSATKTPADGAFPVTITHKLGETTIKSKPERIVSIGSGNEDVVLALGIVPVGMPKNTWGDEDGDGMLSHVKDKITALGGPAPKLLEQKDGPDFEAVAALKPDVILGAYSGLTPEQYKKLSEIAPVVGYTDGPWLTPWREITRLNSKALGLEAKGEQLIAESEKFIATEVAKYPALKGKATMFLTHVDPKDLSTVKFYTPADTRVGFWKDLGLTTPSSVAKASEAGKYAGSISAENADVFRDVDLIVTYGDQELVDLLQGDKLLSQIPALKRNAVVKLDGKTAMGAAAYQSVLSIPATAPAYIKLLAEAAGRS